MMILRSVEACHHLLEHSDGRLCALAGDAERTQHAHQVALVPALAEQDSCLPALLEDLGQQLGVGLLGDLVLHELHGQQHALAPHLPDVLALLPDPPELGQQVAADLLGVLGQLLLADDVQHLHADPALQRSACEGREVVVAQRVRNFPPSDDCGEGGTIGDRLGHHHDVRLHFLPLEPPLLLADPPEASLHLVRNVQSPHLLYQPVQVLDVRLLQRDDPSRTHHRLDPQAGHLPVGVAVQLLLGVLYQRFHRAVRVPVKIGPGESLYRVAFGEDGVPSANAGQVVCVSSCTVIPVPEADHGVALGVSLGQVVSEIVGLATGVEEKDSIEVVAQLLAQFLGELSLVGVGVMRGEIHQFLAFLLVDLGDPGVRVAHVHAGNATDEVDVLPAGLVVEELPVALDCQEGLFVVVHVDGRDVDLVALDFLVGLAGVGPRLLGGERSGSDDQIGNLHQINISSGTIHFIQRLDSWKTANNTSIHPQTKMHF